MLLIKKDSRFSLLKAACFFTGEKSIDNICATYVIPYLASNLFVGIIAYQILTNIPINIIGLVKILYEGRKQPIVFWNFRIQLLGICTGLCEVFATFLFLYASTLGNPEMLVGLSNLLIPCLVVWEIIRKRLHWKIVRLVCIVILGSLLASIIGFRIGQLHDTLMLVGLMTASTLLTAVSELVQKQGAKFSDDHSFSFCHSWWFSVGGTVLAVLWVWKENIGGEMWTAIINGLQTPYMFLYPILAVCFLLGLNLKISLKRENPVSVVQSLLLSTGSILAFVLTYALFWIFKVNHDPIIIACNLTGVTLLFLGSIVLGKHLH